VRFAKGCSGSHTWPRCGLKERAQVKDHLADAADDDPWAQPVYIPGVQENDTLVWRIILESGRAAECWVQLAPAGVKVALRGSSMNMVHQFTTGTEAMAWADEFREDLERQDDGALRAT